MSSAHDIGSEIRRFVQENPRGWGHAEWLGFLHHLGQSGFSVDDPDSLGLALEGERLLQVLERIDLKGLGPKRREALVSSFGTLYDLCAADADRIADLTGIPRSLAEQVAESLQ